jgi:ribosomal protein S18 acetylase RimI-like enzyme
VLTAALRFKREQLLAAVETVDPLTRIPGATVLSTPSLPRVWELNLVLAPPAYGAERLIDVTDGLQAAAGLAHRKLRFDGVASAESLRAAAELRGWTIDRELVMVREPGADPSPHAGRVEELDEDALAAAEDEFLAAEPAGEDPEVRRQLIAQHDRWARSARTASLLGIVEDGRVVAWCRTYDDGTLFELDAVGVLPGRRGRGLGRELVAGAVASAPAGRIAFLLADANDWPRHLYERLGFAAVGERLGATRAPGRRHPH